METINVTEFYKHLGKYFLLCSKGKTFALTKYGKLVCYICPPRHSTLDRTEN